MIRRLGPPALTLFLVFLLGPRPAAATITYQVSLEHQEEHIFRVQISIPNPAPGITIAMPVWNALYQVRDFAYRVRDVRAATNVPDNFRYNVRKIDKQTWRVEYPPPSLSIATAEMIIDYSIQWDDPGPFNSELNGHHGFMNLAEILMYLPDRRQEETVVMFVGLPGNWRAAMELPSTPMMNRPDTFTASSYDALVDAPVEAGKFDDFQFTESGAHFRVVVDADNWNRERLEYGLHEITRYELQLMRGAPFDPPNHEYTFFFHIGPYADVGGGGMEHRNSTVIAATSIDNALAIAAHEFFHVWNVKRIRPQSLEPVDYAKEEYTRALWFAEGVTSCYAAFTLERSGLWSKNQFYADLASQIAELESRPAHQWQSVEESSLDAWFEKYDTYNAPDRSISYYNKGQIVGVLLDLAIRDATDNRKSLDDVFRRMNEEYALQGKFYDDSEGIRAAVEEVAGKNFKEFFRKYVSGTDEIPYDDFLAVAGLELKMDRNKTAAPVKTSVLQTSISEISHLTERQRRIREGLLHGSTD
jgi:predicted metalloprotease with PDZ domain